MTQSRIYLDHAATTPLRGEVLSAMLPYLERPSFNASSLHAEGRAARAALEDARERIAAVLGASRQEIVFVGSGSEANALALSGIARARGVAHIVTSAIEHQAVLRSVESLASLGASVSVLPVDRYGFVDPGAFEEALRPQTVLASVMLANNEIGTIQAIASMAAAARKRGVWFHTDAVAAAGWLPLDVRALGVDALALAPHKFGGPKGFGILYVREDTPLEPIVHGGGQERGRRAGTEDVAAAVGAATALELAEGGREARSARVRALRDRLEIGLLAAIPGSRVNGSEPRLPGIANLSFSGVTAELLALRLDLEGIAASPGSACTAGVAGPSHVAAALGYGDPREAIRFSLGDATTQRQIDDVLQVMPIAVSELRRT